MHLHRTPSFLATLLLLACAPGAVSAQIARSGPQVLFISYSATVISTQTQLPASLTVLFNEPVLANPAPTVVFNRFGSTGGAPQSLLLSPVHGRNPDDTFASSISPKFTDNGTYRLSFSATDVNGLGMASQPTSNTTVTIALPAPPCGNVPVANVVLGQSFFTSAGTLSGTVGFSNLCPGGGIQPGATIDILGPDPVGGAGIPLTATPGGALGFSRVVPSQGNVDGVYNIRVHASEIVSGQQAQTAGNPTFTVATALRGWVQKAPPPGNDPPGRHLPALAYDSLRHRLVLFGGESGPGVLFGDTWEWDGTLWTHRTPANAPSARHAHAMVYDEARARVLLFGGLDSSNGGLADTWTWDGVTWTKMNPATSPPGRNSHAMAYDSVRRRVVLFGGCCTRSDTWEWDGTNWSDRTQQIAPPSRSNHAMAFDEATGTVVLFGGLGINSTPLNDTWDWTGTAWRSLAPATPVPPARFDHAIAYDRVRSKIVLFAGAAGANTTDLADTWEWNGTAWSQAFPSPSPQGRINHAMAYDDSAGGVVLFGGQNGPNQDDTWLYDGSSWSQLGGTAFSPNTPPARSELALAFDSLRNRVVLFGGDANQGASADTWEWDGTVWTRKKPATSPPARFSHCLAFDPVRGKTVLFGGIDATKTPLADTWEWDGTVWTRTATTGPAARELSTMTLDPVRHKILLFGGIERTEPQVGIVYDDTWEYDQNGWRQAAPLTHPGPRGGHRLVYDTPRSRAVLFGGATIGAGGPQAISELWEWDGTNWSQKQAAGPSARIAPVMAFDATRGKTLLFGGGTNPGGPEQQLGDTWEWDGTVWTQKSPLLTALPRQDSAAAYDTARGRVVLFGGSLQNMQLDDTWEWDGAVWAQKGGSLLQPTGRSRHAMTYDEARRRTVLFGGLNWNRNNDTWTWDGAAWQLQAPASVPAGRGYPALAYDSDRSRTVLFGGEGDPGNVPLDDTWEWDGTNWLQLTPVSRPPARLGHAMAFDALRSRVVLFGGASQISTQTVLVANETWEWDGTVWTNRTPATSPPARCQHAMAYDAVRHRTVLFGGAPTFSNDTWEWDGTVWTQRQASSQAASPPQRQGAAMAFDALRSRIVLFGGFGFFGSANDTWDWDGTAWTAENLSPSPQSRTDSALAFDSASGKLVVFGGRSDGPNPGGDMNDTWELGKDPIRTTLRGGPVARASASGVNGAASQILRLDGTASAGDGLTYAWSLASAPTGASRLSSATPVVFYKATLPGDYTFVLVVTDSRLNAASANVAFRIAPTPPVAIVLAPPSFLLPNPAVTLPASAATTAIRLDGSASFDPVSTAPLAYQWSLTSAPSSSSLTSSFASLNLSSRILFVSFDGTLSAGRVRDAGTYVQYP